MKKPGEWNHITVVGHGKQITVTLNGQTVTQFDMSKWTSATKNPDGSDIPPWEHASGGRDAHQRATSACKASTPACRRYFRNIGIRKD